MVKLPAAVVRVWLLDCTPVPVANAPVCVTVVVALLKPLAAMVRTSSSKPVPRTVGSLSTSGARAMLLVPDEKLPSRTSTRQPNSSADCWSSAVYFRLPAAWKAWLLALAVTVSVVAPAVTVLAKAPVSPACTLVAKLLSNVLQPAPAVAVTA